MDEIIHNNIVRVVGFLCALGMVTFMLLGMHQKVSENAIYRKVKTWFYLTGAVGVACSCFADLVGNQQLSTKIVIIAYFFLFAGSGGPQKK